MTHDVTKDPLDPAMRAWVDKAAGEVVEYVHRAGRLTPPVPGPHDPTCKPGQALTELERRVASLVELEWDDHSIGWALQIPPQVVGRLKANVITKRTATGYSPMRRFDEAD